MKDLNSESITQHTIRTNSQSPNLRLVYVLERLVTHIHAFASETRLSTEEWMAGLKFLTEVGQKCTDVRQACNPVQMSPIHMIPTQPVGIHTPFRYLRALPSGRFHRSSKPPVLHRKVYARSVPYS